MERQLATIQMITKLTPIPEADAIETAQILGWTVVVKKGDFKVGDLCVYAEIDSVLPEHPAFEFLRPATWVDNGVVKGFRIKTVRLRKQLSQGIAFPTSLLQQFPNPMFDDLRSHEAMMWKQLRSGSRMDEKFIGTDVTDAIGVIKYERPIPAQLAGLVKRDFPQHIMPKTDETRIQSIPHILDTRKNTLVYIAEKLDGTSCTFYYDRKSDTFGVCSRNLELKVEEANKDNEYVKMAKTLGIEEGLRKLNQSIAIQGEIVGPGIQDNKYQLTKPEFRLFNAYMIESKQYLSYHSLLGLAQLLGIPMVPISYVNLVLSHTLEELLVLAEGPSALNPAQTREGVVIRAMFEDIDDEPNAKGDVLGRLSFKVISNKFLETEDE